MSLMKKLHNRRQPAGLEWAIFKKLPKLLMASTLIPVMVSLLARLFPQAATADEKSMLVTRIDFISIGLGITLWTAVFTITIGCIIVIIMKGPAYVADAYELNDSEYPRPGKRKG